MATISAAAQAHPIVAPIFNTAFVDPKTGIPTMIAQQFMQQIYAWVVGINRMVPCDATGTNTIALTVLSIAPQIDAYSDFETYGFIAAATSNGNLSANVTTSQGTLATLNVYKANGATRAGSGDTVLGSQYFLTYVDSLNSAAGGFVLR